MNHLDEVRRRAVSRLSSSGLAQDVRADVQLMVNIPLSLSSKYRHIAAESMVRDNATGRNRQEVRSASSFHLRAN